MILSILNVFFKQKCVLNSMSKNSRKIHNRNKLITLNNSPVPVKKCKIDPSLNLNIHLRTMPSNANVEVLSSPVKSANDKKEYKVIRLENGLVACLISDLTNPEAFVNNLEEDDESESENEELSSGTETDTEESDNANVEADESDAPAIKKLPEEEEKLAAAALCVNVGSFSDPESIPGMAHFLEHMVFMGSKKYPEENDFDSFLKKRGGSDNAQTDTETTVFYFECMEKYLGGALDRFAQFFISPLMKREAMTREREAIESEFQMAIQSDEHRKEQLLSSFSKSGSPVSGFLWGNQITLRDNVTDDALFEAVHEFRRRHYSAHRMTLAIQGRLPIDLLESYVVNCFAPVPNNSLPKDDFTPHADGVFDTPAFNRMYYVKPVKDLCQVDLNFVLPSLLHKYKSKPHHYVATLLGHEGKGSLLSYLKDKLWALSVVAGNAETGTEHNTMYTFFTISLVLTPDGLKHIYEVIEAVFSYINMLKEVGPQERIFNEIKIIQDNSFRFKDEKDAIDFVEEFAETMQYYPPEEYFTGWKLYTEYDPEAISMVVNKLDPHNVNIMVLSSTVPEDITYDKVEPWFSTNYTERDIPQHWLENWTKAKPMECFALPEENKYLTTNFALLDLSETVVPEYPKKLLDTELVELWYKQDNKFKLPYAYMCYYFCSSLCQKSALNVCMLELFMNLLDIQLSLEAYPASVAGLSYSTETSDNGLIIKVGGYNQKLPLLLELIIRHIKNVPVNTTDAMFMAVKDKLEKSYYNWFLKPTKLARAVRMSTLIDVFWPPLDRLNAMKQVTFDVFQEYSRNFLQKLHVQALIQGNVSQDIVLKTNNEILSILQCEPLPVAEITEKRIVQVPIGKLQCKVMSFNQKDTNSIVTNYYQYGPGTLKTLMIIEVIMLIIEEPLFNTLRTQEQLGYNVYSSIYNSYGVLGYYIFVNSQINKHSTEHVDERIELFVKSMGEAIKRMSFKKIQQFMNDLIKIKQLVDVHLKDEVSRNWSEIVDQDFMFDRVAKEIATIKKIRLCEIRKWLLTFCLDVKNARKLSIQIVGHKEQAGENLNEIPRTDTDSAVAAEDYKLQMVDDNSDDHKLITNIEQFKNGLHLFPVHKIK